MVVDSGYEKLRKRKKPTKKLLVGEHVEVLFSDEGLRGSWHSGIVIDCREYTRLVEYTNLVSEDNCSKLKESIPVSDAIEGLPTKTRKYHRGHIRPSPPHCEIHEAEINYGLCVDALVDDAWWEGVVFDHAESLKERLIFFPDQGDQQMVSMDRLRLSQVWNEVSGYWKPRGVWLLLQVLQPLEQEEELPVSVREIWFDLRTTATFSEKIGVWTFGSQSTWHILVSELIQELQSVVHGLVPFEQQMDFPVSYDTVDIPNDQENACLAVALNNPVLLTLGDHSLSASSSDERCADESLSHQATENMNIEGSRGGLKNSDAFSLQTSKNDYCGSKNDYCGSKNPILLGENCGSATEASESEYEEAIDCSRSYNRLARKNKGAGKAWKPVDLEAAFYPEAVKICASKGLRKAMVPDVDLPGARQKAWKHLLALGWKIETRKDEHVLRVRFRSLEGKSYYSLFTACCALLQGHRKMKQKHRKDKQTNAGCGEFVNTKSHQNSACLQQAGKGLLRRGNCRRGGYSPDASSFASQSNRMHTGKSQSLSDLITAGAIEEISSSRFEEHWHTASHALSSEEDLLLNGCETVSHVYDDLEAGYFPRAVLEYKRYLDLSSDERKNVLSCDLNLIMLNARKHLKFMGWKFWIQGRPDRRCFFITSPSGKHFQSLYSACDEYAREEYLKNSVVRGSLERVECRPAIFSNYKDSRGFRDDKLSVERDRKLKRRKVITHTVLPSTTLGDRKVKHCSTKSSVCEKSKRRNECQALLRQGNELGNCLSPHGTEPRKRPQQSMLQTYSQRVARTVLSELLDNGIISLRADVSYIRKKDGKVLMEGQITRDGIKCKCCKMVYTPSNFEAHAGSTYRRPAASIFLQDSGKSLLECKMKMVQSKKPKDSRRRRMKVDCSEYLSDTVCTICHDGGSLVLCDHCPSSFHLECVGLEGVPKGKWFCPSCRCGACGMSEFNSDTEQFTEKTILYCDQCEREYHVGCMRKRGDESLSCCPAGNWFCSEKCSEIFLHLRQLLGISKPTSVEGLSLTILRSGRENGVDNLQFDAAITTEHDSKLCVALNILHECFVTITEPRTQSDFVADLLFNRESELRRLNFYGFYTILLEKGDELVSVASFRVYGDKVAEMPLVGTRVKYRNQGMCRLLVNELEKLLSELGVENLVLPAVPQLLQTWTSSFGFSKMTSSDRLNLLEYTILCFQETTMCWKLLKKRDPTAMSKPKGQFKKLMDTSRSTKKGDSELYNSVSEADGMVEPIHALSSVHTDQFNQTGHQIDAEHSPVSTCTNPIQQTEMEPGQNDIEKVAPPKIVDSKVSVDTSPILALMAPTNIDPQMLKKCCEHIDKDDSIRQQHYTVKNVNTGAENSFKYVYRRKISRAN